MHKMVYVYVTDYVANSGWFSALVNGKLATTVDQNTVLLVTRGLWKDYRINDGSLSLSLSLSHFSR